MSYRQLLRSLLVHPNCFHFRDCFAATRSLGSELILEDSGMVLFNFVFYTFEWKQRSTSYFPFTLPKQVFLEMMKLLTFTWMQSSSVQYLQIDLMMFAPFSFISEAFGNIVFMQQRTPRCDDFSDAFWGHLPGKQDLKRTSTLQ